MFTIPTFSDPFYEQVIPLEGADYQFTWLWNRRGSFWSLSIADQESVPIVSGRRIVVDFNLLRRCTDPRRPPGLLVAEDTSGAGLDPDQLDFGTRVLLRYWTAAEVAASLALTAPPPVGT